MSGSVLAEYEALEERALEALHPALSEEEFNTLALDIHRFQRRWNAPYAAWCATQPEPSRWQDIPAVPQAMFKRFRLSCFPPELVTKVFRTSGTTGETRGEHHLRDTRLYEAAVLAGWPQVEPPPDLILFLSLSPTEARDSSLVHMFETIGQAALVERGEYYYLCDPQGRLDQRQTEELFWREDRRFAIFGTALAFLNMFEQLGDRRIRLAAGSYALETGGFKGSGREIAKAELYARFEEHLGLPADRVWNEYGMCELSSQFYTRGLGNPHRGGPWVRARVISPRTGEEAEIGETGVLRIFDLANAGSVLAVQTADLAIRRADGFELLGRDPAAIPRGCSRAADEAMRAARVSPGSAAPARRGSPSLGTTRERAAILAEAAAAFPFLGSVTADDLLALVRLELGHEDALDRFVPYGRNHARAIAPGTILHVLSGNTPAAALQTLLRGLLLGARNWCKLPSDGLPEVEQFLGRLPAKWREEIEISAELPDAWLREADAVIVFGSDETIAHFRGRIAPGQVFVPHGHKLSFGVVFDDAALASAAGAARDASVFDQQGCLSPTVFFIRETDGFTIEQYAERLAVEMERYAAIDPPAPLTLSEANAIVSLRDEMGFRISNGEPARLWVSAGLEWTVIAERSLGFPTSPLNRLVFVKPWTPDSLAELAPLRGTVSTIGIWPSTQANAEAVATIGAHRLCPIGKMQSPPLTWHHDGKPVLAPLVTWVDWEA